MSEKESSPTVTAPVDNIAQKGAEDQPRLGIPTKRRRTTKVDSVLAAAKDVALTAVLGITDEETVGTVHHLRGEEDRLTTHLFECTLPGYRGWFWFATLSRFPRSKKATICEVGLLPGDDALLAPQWVPWSERLKHVSIEDLEELEESSELAAELDELRSKADDAAGSRPSGNENS